MPCMSLEITANFLPGSDAGTSVTHAGFQNEMKFQPNLSLRIFLCPVCHLKVTANFLPGSDAGTSVTHPGFQNEIKFQRNLSLRIFLCHCVSLESNGKLSSRK